MRFGVDTTFLLVIGAFAFFAALYDGGWAMVRKGTFEGVRMFVKFIPFFVVAFFTVGLAKVLVDKYIDFERLGFWFSGPKGILVALLGGIFTPIILPLYPLFKEMWDHNVGRTAVIMFLVALSLNWQVLLFRAPILGWGITLFSFGGAFVGVFLIAILFMLWEYFAR